MKPTDDGLLPLVHQSKRLWQGINAFNLLSFLDQRDKRNSKALIRDIRYFSIIRSTWRLLCFAKS